MGCWRNRIEESFFKMSPCDDCPFFKGMIQNMESKDSKVFSKNKINVLTYICEKDQSMYTAYKDQVCSYNSRYNTQKKESFI